MKQHLLFSIYKIFLKFKLSLNYLFPPVREKTDLLVKPGVYLSKVCFFLLLLRYNVYSEQKLIFFLQRHWFIVKSVTLNRQWRKKFVRIDSWCQLYQHFPPSFYTYRSQKRKKFHQAICLFALLGSACVKAVSKILVKSTPGRLITIHQSSTSKGSLHWVPKCWVCFQQPEICLPSEWV